MKKIVIGIMSQDKIRKRILDIARGDYKPKRNEPKVWFPSMKSVAEVLIQQATYYPGRIAYLHTHSIIPPLHPS